MHLHFSNEVKLSTVISGEANGKHWVAFVAELVSGQWRHYVANYQSDTDVASWQSINFSFAADTNQKVVFAQLLNEPGPDSVLFVLKRKSPPLPDVMECEPVTSSESLATQLAALNESLGTSFEIGDLETLALRLGTRIVFPNAPSTTVVSDDLIFSIDVDDAVPGGMMGDFVQGTLSILPENEDPTMIQVHAEIVDGSTELVFNCGPRDDQPEDATYQVHATDAVDTATFVGGSWPP